jgi:hypothetical protein
MKTADIVSQLAPGMARTSRFAILLSPPAYATENMGRSNANLQKVLLFCDSVSLPGLNVNTNPTRTFGEVREIPNEFNYEPITATFYVDADMYTKKMFDNWILGIQYAETRAFRYYDDYISEMRIFVHDTKDNERYVVNLYEVYPKSIGAIQLDYANTQIMKVTITFQYKYWRSEKNDMAMITKNINSNGGFGLATVAGFFQYGLSALLSPVTNFFNSWFGFQESVNRNLSQHPEGLGNRTGTPPVHPSPTPRNSSYNDN